LQGKWFQLHHKPQRLHPLPDTLAKQYVQSGKDFDELSDFASSKNRTASFDLQFSKVSSLVGVNTGSVECLPKRDRYGVGKDENI
jgi:hypothetical protein